MKTLLALPLLAFLLNASAITVTTPIPVTGHGALFSGIPFVAPYYVITFSGTDSTDSISFCCDTGSIDAVGSVAGAHATEGDSFTVDGVTSSMFVTVFMNDSEIFGVESYNPVNPTSVIASVDVIGYFTNQVTTPICNGPLGCNGSETTFDISPTPVLAPEAPTVFGLLVGGLIWVCGRIGQGLRGPRQNLRSRASVRREVSLQALSPAPTNGWPAMPAIPITAERALVLVMSLWWSACRHPYPSRRASYCWELVWQWSDGEPFFDDSCALPRAARSSGCRLRLSSG